MDKLAAIKTFIAVAEYGSFTAAAEHLDCSKAMISRHIALLENWFGARLLHRTTRRISLTEAGTQALDYFYRIHHLVEDAEWGIAPDSDELNGTLRITASTSFGTHYLASAISRFGMQHPKLHIHLHVGDHVLNLIENRIDLAIRISDSPDPSLIARPLAPCRSLLVATPDYLEQHGTPMKPEELMRHCCLAHSNLNRNKWTFTRSGENESLHLTNTLTSNDALVLLMAALNHGGIAMLPRYLINKELEKGRLKTILTDWNLPEMTVYALYSSRRLPQAARVFLDFLIADCASQEW